IETEKSDDPTLTSHPSPRSRLLGLLKSKRKLLVVAAACLVALLVTGLGFRALNLFKGKAIRSVAVLPVTNRGADTGINYLSAGLAESSPRKLSRLTPLRVKAPTVIGGDKDQPVDARQLGRDLNVDAVLIGEVTGQGESAVIKLALVRTDNGAPIW